MRTLINAVRADASAHSLTLRTFWIIAAAVVAMNIVVGGHNGIAYAPIIAAATTMFLPANFFAQDERSKLTTMYEILPITRGRVVAGRYLLVALVLFVSTLVGLALLLGGRALFPADIDTPLMVSLGALGLTVLAVALICAVQMPILYALGHARTGVLTMGATMLLLFGAVALLKQFPDAVPSMTDVFGSPWTLPVCALVSVLILGASAALSAGLYARRDL